MIWKGGGGVVSRCDAKSKESCKVFILSFGVTSPLYRWVCPLRSSLPEYLLLKSYDLNVWYHWVVPFADGLGSTASSLYTCVSPREFGVCHRLPCRDWECVLNLRLCKINEVCCRRTEGLLITFETWSFHSFTLFIYLPTMNKTCVNKFASLCPIKRLQTFSVLSQ